MKRRQICFSIVFLFFSVGFPVYAAFNPLSISDSSSIREDIYYTWLTRSLDDLREEKAIIRKNEAGDYFRVSFVEYEKEFAIICNPMVENDFPEKTSGSWILYRDKETEKALRIEFYFTQSSEVYFTFKPSGTKTSIDLRIFNAYLIKDHNFSLPFRDFYTLSIPQFYALSKNLFPWHFFTPEEKLYDANIQIASQLREYQDMIDFVPNRAYDENGKPSQIFDSSENLELNTRDNIESNEILEDSDKLQLGSLGYVKWVVDGLVYPQIASYLKIQALKKATVDTSPRSRVETLSSRETIYAALDWTRNLATAYASVQLGMDLDFFTSGTEVNHSFFSLSFDSHGKVRDSAYVKNSGYSSHILKPLLYMLALTEPERMYIAAIKDFRSDTEEGKLDIGRFRDALVFLPYFDAKREFQCPVFYAGKEINLDELIANSENDFFSLVRIKTELRFYPLKKE
jgi:hypothetical protein